MLLICDDDPNYRVIIIELVLIRNYLHVLCDIFNQKTFTMPINEKELVFRYRAHINGRIIIFLYFLNEDYTDFSFWFGFLFIFRFIFLLFHFYLLTEAFTLFWKYLFFSDFPYLDFLIPTSTHKIVFICHSIQISC